MISFLIFYVFKLKIDKSRFSTPIRNLLKCWHFWLRILINVWKIFMILDTNRKISHEFSVNSLFVLKDSVNVRSFLILNPNRKSLKMLTFYPCLRIVINVWRYFLILNPTGNFLWIHYEFSVDSLFVLKDFYQCLKIFLILNPNRKSSRVLTVCSCLRILINVWRYFLILDPNRKSPMNSVLTVCSC